MPNQGNAAHLPKTDARRLLDRAVSLHRAGAVDEAVEYYRSVLSADPRNADAHHLLGVALLGSDAERTREALTHLRVAVEGAPGIGEFHADLAVAQAAVGAWDRAGASLSRAAALGERVAARFHGSACRLLRDGRWDDAEAWFRVECSHLPRAEAWNNLGVALLRMGRVRDAIDVLEQGLAQTPDDPHLLRNLGAARIAEREWRSAVICFERVLKTNPSDADAARSRAEALRGLGGDHLRAGRFVAAAEALESSLRSDPDSAGAWNNLGLALRYLKRDDRAIDCFRQAVERRPDLVSARVNLADALIDAERWDEAVGAVGSIAEGGDGVAPGAAVLHRVGRAHAGAERWEAASRAWERAIQADPDSVEPRLGLGDIAEKQGRLEDAARWYDEAARRAPATALAWAKLGIVARKLGDGARSRTAFAELERCEPSPEAAYMRTTASPVIYDSVEDVAAWRRRLETEVRDLCGRGAGLDANKSVLSTPFLFAYQGYNDRELNERLASLWKTHAAPAPRTPPPARRDRIKIAFLSSFLKYHTIGKLTRGWIKELSRDAFEVIVLSPYDHHDAGADWIRTAADRTVILDRTIEKAMQRVADERCDVLFYPDIGMDPVTYGLARHRLAPVQCTTWGHPVTSGLRTVDYFVSSRLLEIPEAQRHYTEQLVLLDTLPTYYYRPPVPTRGSIGELPGISDAARLYLCPHSHFKMHPAFDTVLRRVLELDPDGVIGVIDGMVESTSGRLRRRFERTLAPHAGRVRFIPRLSAREYLDLLERSDVLLDSFPFGGGNTHYEAFSVGLPVVTWPSEFMRGRVGHALCRKMGIPYLVVDSAESYARRAVEIASSPSVRDRLREEILARNDRIYEDMESVRELERFLRDAVRRVGAARGGRAASDARHAAPRPTATCDPTPPNGAKDAARSVGVPSPPVGPGDLLRVAMCPACGHHVAAPFFQPGELPLATLAWPTTRAESLDMPKLPHDFVRCVDCGHVFNAAFDYAHVPYSTKPNLMFNRGAIWREHLESVARLLLTRLDANPVVVEVGCGDGHMLRTLAESRPDGRFIGFDPNSAIDTGGGRIEARNELFEPSRHVSELRPDLVISRHVLEHLMNPLGFVQSLEFAVSWVGRTTRLFIEVPCIDQVFGLRRTTDFYYEHNSHFTTTSLRRMLLRCAGRVDLLRTAYGGEVACALATFEPREAQVAIASESLAFRDDAVRMRSALRAELDAIIASNARMAIWGGTGKGAAFIQQLGLDFRRFPRVVDSDSGKAGTFVPGGGQRIEPRESLLTDPVDIILIATPWRAADIFLEMRSIGIQCRRVLIEHEGTLVDFEHGTHAYRLPAPSDSPPIARRIDRPGAPPIPAPIASDTHSTGTAWLSAHPPDRQSSHV